MSAQGQGATSRREQAKLKLKQKVEHNMRTSNLSYVTSDCKAALTGN